MNKTLEFLFQYHKKTMTPSAWSRLLEIEIIDDDGWRDKNAPSFNQAIPLAEYIDRVAQSTIKPV